MVQLTDASGLRREVGHDLGVREQRGLDLLLGLVVRADGGDKRAGSDHFALNEVAAGGRARHHDVA